MKYYTGISSKFYCTQCGKEGIPIQRIKGQERKSGHLKKLYCIYCGKEINHVEIKENDNTYNYNDFIEEFKMGRFKNGEKDNINELISCSNITCLFNKNKKCWNSNYSNNCGYRIIHKGE